MIILSQNNHKLLYNTILFIVSLVAILLERYYQACDTGGGGMGGLQLKVREGFLSCLTCICMGLRFCGLKQQERLVCSPPLHPENLYLDTK